MTKTLKAKAAQKPATESKIKYVFAPILKYSYVSMDEDENPVDREIVYVGKDNRAHRAPCGSEIYARVQGKRRAKAAHTALYKLVHNAYAIGIDSSTGQVVSVDTFPAQLYTTGGKSAPEFRKAQEYIEIVVDSASGSLTFTQVPPGSIASESALLRLIRDIHKVKKTVKEGDVVSGYEVTHVAGNRIRLEVAGDED